MEADGRSLVHSRCSLVSTERPDSPKGLNITNFKSKFLVGAIAILVIFAHWSAPAQAQVLAVEGVFKLAMYAAKAVENIKGSDDKKREAFTQEFANQAQQNYPNYNVVISHNVGQVTDNGAIHRHVEVNMTVG